ncbi:DUF1631 domain-containing protein [Luteimonas sp. S4-F44]|uniref:DUF1631 family protein n=1 Tax=Luteimonas sp. S4-F44 TaxID=2925842 RepID=UPI001F53993A|nr:DUF1631 family protein [Luteimonas sp. S4-F44]UNK43205.1 DUF1631 domain-containing protein [Luteimonas sp. S4-F44]
MTHPHDIGPAPHARRPTPGEPEAVFDALRRDAVTALGEVLSTLWDEVEAQVERDALGAAVDYMAAQDARLAARALRMRAPVLAASFRAAIEAAFERWRSAASPRPAHDAMALMSEGQLELHLAVEQQVDLLEHQWTGPLTALDGRMAVLASRLGVADGAAHPLRPAVPVQAFAGLLDPDALPRDLRAQLFQQLGARLPAVLAGLYARADTLLDTAFGPVPATPAAGRGGRAPAWQPEGGLAEARADTADVADAARDSARPAQRPLSPDLARLLAASGPDTTDTDPRGAELVLVRAQLHRWRAQRARTPASPSEDAPALDVPPRATQTLEAAKLLSVARLLQGDDPSPYARVLAGDDRRRLGDVIRLELARGLRGVGIDPDRAPLSGDDEDVIDLVGLLFQALFEANDLMQQARDLYGRLVMPCLKVALTDETLFSQRGHPARRLLDAVTEACDGNTGDTAVDRDLLEHAGRLVDRVVEEYETDQAVFALAAEELRDRLDQQRRRTEVAERRAAEAIHGRERLQQARRGVAALVAERMTAQPLTDAVARFLDQHWRHHLTQTWLRDGPDSPRHRAAVAIGDAMIGIDLDAAAADGTAVAASLRALQGPLADCYASGGLDAAAAREEVTRIVAALARCDAPRRLHTPLPEDEALDEPSDPLLRLVDGTATPAFDPTIAARMRQLRPGQGLRLIDEHGRQSVARVAWISPLTSRLLIVNRRGVRRMVVSPEELAALVGAGRALVRSIDAPFDEAMKHLWQHLSAANDDVDSAAVG